MRKYETLLIARPDLEEDQLKALIDELLALIGRKGGKVLNVDVWGLRRLEYPIEHQERGQYAVVDFEAESEVTKELERVAGLKDEILRIKTLVKERK